MGIDAADHKTTAMEVDQRRRGRGPIGLDRVIKARADGRLITRGDGELVDIEHRGRRDVENQRAALVGGARVGSRKRVKRRPLGLAMSSTTCAMAGFSGM